MPPKNKKQKEIVQDERFQAIVLTDLFQTRFMPLTASKPRCLLPLANVPLIDYTLEFLAKLGVNEVYLMCSSHADQIQEYIENSKWTTRHADFSIHTIMSLESRSVGDAMRDLDNRGLITGDFLLVSGDVVTNIDFDKAMKVHKEHKATDKNHIVTMVLLPAGPVHRTRSYVDPAAFILDKQTNRCLYYQEIPPVDGKKSSITIDPELLEDVEDEFTIRNDLIDCHIDICSPHVPQIFQENFDYQELRNDFVKGVLTSDLLKKTIYAYIADTSEYSARAESWSTYHAVSQDILGRWCYPLVPDTNWCGNTSYSYEFSHVYKEDRVVLAQSCKVGNCTAIGLQTTIGEKTVVRNSVIGKNCTIGKNVQISHAYIWDNTTIEDDVVVEGAVVGNNATIRCGARLATGAVIGFNVVVGAGRDIGHNVRVIDEPVIHESDGFSDEESEQIGDDVDVVGPDGHGSLYISDREVEEESDSESLTGYTQNSGLIYHMAAATLSDTSIASISNKKRRHARHNLRSRRFSTTSAMSTDYAYTDEEEEENFDKEAFATVERAIENDHDIDTAALELNTLKMSMNVTYREVRQATAAAMLQRIHHFISTGTLSAKDATTKVFLAWAPLFRRQVFDDWERVDLLQIIQSKLVGSEHNQVILFVAVKTLYDLDIVEEENILEWWNSEASQTAELIETRGLTASFITWLEDAEEESELE